MKIGDETNTPNGQGKIKEILSDGRVAVVEIEEGNVVYVRMPEND